MSDQGAQPRPDTPEERRDRLRQEAAIDPDYARLVLTAPDSEYPPELIREAEFVVSAGGTILKDRFSCNEGRRVTSAERATCKTVTPERAAPFLAEGAQPRHRGGARAILTAPESEYPQEFLAEAEFVIDVAGMVVKDPDGDYLPRPAMDSDRESAEAVSPEEAAAALQPAQAPLQEARELPTPLLMYMLAQRARESGGGKLLVRAGEKGWAVEFAARTGSGALVGGGVIAQDRLRRALEVAGQEAGLWEIAAEEEVGGLPDGWPPEVMEMYAHGANEASRRFPIAEGAAGTQSDNLFTALAVALASNTIVMTKAGLGPETIFGGAALAAFLAAFSDPNQVPPEVEAALATVDFRPHDATFEDEPGEESAPPTSNGASPEPQA
jgi:hypothetical protein